MKLKQTESLNLEYVNNIHWIAFIESRQKQQDNQNKPQKHREPNKTFYQYMKKDQNLPNKNIHSTKNSSKPLPDNYNVSRQQSPYRYNYRGRSPDKKNSRYFSWKHYSQSNSQINSQISK